VSWLVPDNGGAPLKNYVIYRGSSSGSDETPIATIGAAKTSYLDKAAKIGTFYYRVAGGEQKRSEPIVRRGRERARSATTIALQRGRHHSGPGPDGRSDRRARPIRSSTFSRSRLARNS